MSDVVDPSLIAQFNLAGRAGRAGDAAGSLALYRQALSRATSGRVAATDEFVATCRMRAAFCLMDLGRYEEALSELRAAEPLKRTLGKEGEYEYYFALGNTYGRLGRLQEAFSALVEAISRAEDLDDYTGRPEACWTWILAHAENASDWEFLEAKAEIAVNNAALRGMPSLHALATEKLKKARKLRRDEKRPYV